ncbi:ABC transporter permease [Embleya scabrispora]|uniref:ABC transporter permease n=1 Tax=Embleya scabrispora TaxID=159449 RepID=UPI00039D8BE7|nr:ABC transporter permease [Embleya scabrispora]MYS81852.1 ABC transporter permease subunit [Streptomyces sp. SID5474]
MRRYLVRRLLQAVVVLWAAFTVSFIVLFLLPGDSLSIKLGGLEGTATREQIDAVRGANGLDDPIHVQYAHALGDALTGDLGTSAQTGAPVAGTIVDALPQTLQLTGVAMVLAVLGGGGVALAATFTRLRALRQVLLSLPAIGISMPGFWVGLLLVQVVSFQWGLLPAMGNEGWESVVLPALTLALPAGAMVAQVLAKSMTTALAEPYVETARAKGAGRVRIHLRHALRNASLPALTLAAVVSGNVLVESVVVETVFSRAGIGRLTAAAVDNQDVAMVQGVVLLAALVFVLVALVVDLLYPVLDPRVGRAV